MISQLIILIYSKLYNIIIHFYIVILTLRVNNFYYSFSKIDNKIFINKKQYLKIFKHNYDLPLPLTINNK